MVRFLLSAGAEVDSCTSAGYTPLHQAAQQGHHVVINLLLENKAKPNAVTNVRFFSSQICSVNQQLKVQNANFTFYHFLERTNCIGHSEQTQIYQRC